MLKLDVQSSTTIKYKKPFSKFTWLKEGDEYGLYALQGSKPNHLVLATGKAKKVEILKQFWSHLVNINYSLNGHHCVGVLDDGDVMVWHVNVKLPPQRISSPLSGGQLQSRGGIKIFVSNSSYQVLLVSAFNEFFLCKIEDDQSYAWWQITVGCFSSLSDADKTEAVVDAQFYHDVVNGDSLSCAVAYSPSATSNIITVHHFTAQLLDDSSTDPFHIYHKMLSYNSDALSGCPNAPRGRGALVMRHSPNGKLIALAVNYHKKSHSRVVFLSSQYNVMAAVSPYGERKDYGRAWWITDMAWTADGLLLVCIIKRGSLLILPCMGRPLQLVTRGCSLDMGPAILLPLHPRISFILAGSSKGSGHVDNEVSLSSERDSYKQKFSVASHPTLPLILCSDGYLLTIMKLEDAYSLTSLVTSLVKVSKAKLSQCNDTRTDIDNSTNEMKRKKSLSSISLHHHPNAFSDISNFPDVAQTVESSLHNAGKYTVRFAGIDSIHDTSHHQSDTDPLNHVFSPATTAFCLLLNSEILLPYSGMFPHKGTIDSAKMDSIYSDVVKAGDIMIAALLGTDGSVDSTTNSIKSSFSVSQLAPVVLKIFELMPLDTNCSHYGLFSKLIFVFLQLYFTELHHGNDHWSVVLKYNYNDKVKFIGNYCHRISTTADLLHYIIECINHTYDMSYCICSDEMSPVPSVSFLIPSLQSLVKDVYFFINLLKNIFAQNQPNVLDHVKKSIHTSLEVLKFAKHWLTLLTGTKPPSKKLTPGIDQYMQGNQLKAMQIFEQHYSEMHSQIGTTRPFNLFAAADGKMDSELTELCLCIICHKLSQYNINGAIRFAHSFIFNAEPKELTSSVSLNEAKEISDSVYSDVCINSCCGLAVIQCLAKLMCYYFTNRPLHIPSLSSIGCTTSDKHIELDRTKLAKAITEQDIQLLWCPEHALKLLLLSGLWEEAVEFPLQLGDWKKAFLLSVAIQEVQDCRTMCFHTNTSKDFQFNLMYVHINNLLQCYKGIMPILPEESQTTRNRRPPSVISMTQSEKDSPRGDLMANINSLLHTAAVCDVDGVLLQMCYNCLDDLINAVHQLDLFVPHGVHLPSPPLYCPQPSVDQSVMLLNPKEWSLRQVMYKKVQQLLFLLRASHSLVPCIKCYALGISSLAEFIQQDGECFNSLPTRSGSATDVSVPTIIQSIMSRAEIGFDIFKSESGDSGCPHTAKVLLAIFRQLCVLLWYLHVRENATIHFRKLQLPANVCQEYDLSIADNAVAWCARLLPFVKFIESDKSKEDEIENSILSLLLELPMDSHFVSLFAHCFPLATESFNDKSDKWRSLMSRVKLKLDLYNAKHDEVKSPVELYTEKSKVRLKQLNSSTFQISLFENTISQVAVDSGSSLELTANALYVGSWEFEYDIVYIEFLDTLISILSPIEETVSRLNYSITSLSKDHAPSYRPPLIAAYYSQRVDSKSLDSDDAVWNSVTAFVEQIHRWAHVSSTLPSTPSELPSMRVGVHLKFLLNCLQLYSRPTGSNDHSSVEYHESNTTITDVTQSDGDDSRVSPVDVPDFPEHKSSSPQCEELLVEHLMAKTSSRSAEIIDQSSESVNKSSSPQCEELLVEHLMAKTSSRSVEIIDQSSESVNKSSSPQCEELLVEHLMAKTSSRSVEIMDQSSESVNPTKLLLQFPQGTLQGQLSQYEVSSLHKSVSSYLHDSSHTSFKQSIPHHHTGTILNEEFSVGERIGSTYSDNVFSDITTIDEVTSTTSNTSSLSTGEVIPIVNKQEFTCRQETVRGHNLSVQTSLIVSEAHNEMDSEAADNDDKATIDNDKITTDSVSSSSNNSTLIAEDNTEIVQVQPIGLLAVSDTQPQPIITSSSKENDQGDIVRSVSDQSTLSQSCEEKSESITHSITQPKITAELVVVKQLESNHTIATNSDNSKHDTAAAPTTLSQHHDNVSTDNVSTGSVSGDHGGYMEKDSLCTTQSTTASANQLVQDNVLISRSQLRKVLKAELRKLLPPVQDDSKSKPDSVEVSVQCEIPSSDSVKSTSSRKAGSSSVEAMVEKHVYQEISSSESTPSLLEVKDLEESPDELAVDKTHITVVVADDTPRHYNTKRTPRVNETQKRKSKTHRKLRKPSQIIDESLSDSVASKTVSGINSSQSTASTDVVPGANSNNVQEKNTLPNQHKDFPLLQLTNMNTINQDDMRREFPGLVKSLQTFDNATQHNKSFIPQHPETQHPVSKMEYGTVSPQNHVPSYFKAIHFSNEPAPSHDPSHTVQGHKNTSRFHNPFPLLNVATNVPDANCQSDFKFPLIPFKPFVPKLIKPNDFMGRNKESKPFPLLHCENPSYPQAKQGYPLLKLPEKEFYLESSKISQPMHLNKHHHEVSSQSSNDSMSFVKVDPVPSSANSIKTKQRHRRVKKSRPSSKPNFVESSVQTDTLIRSSSPVRVSVESSKVNRLAEKVVQTSPPQSPKNKTVMTPPPVLIQHQGLEMKRIEMRQSQRVTLATASPIWQTTPSPLQQTTASPLQQTTASPLQQTTSSPLQQTTASPLQQSAAMDYTNIHTSDIVPSTGGSDTANSGSRVEVTHTTTELHTSSTITDQDDKISYHHVSVDHNDKLLHKHNVTAYDDQEDRSSHKQSFLNVMDIEGELVVNHCHKETTSISDTSVQSSVQGIALLMEHNGQNVTEDSNKVTQCTTIDTGGPHSVMLTKLREMDEQLTSIENTAKKVEGEFQDSNQILDTINQLQQVKALHKIQARQSAPTKSSEPVAPQTAAVVTESLTKPSPNASFTPVQFSSLQSLSNGHLTDELIYAASTSNDTSDDNNVISEIDPTGTLVEMNVEQVSNVIPSSTNTSKSNDGPVSMHHVIGSASELSPVVRRPATKRRLSSTKQSLASTVIVNQTQRRKQEKSNNEKRLRDAFSLMNDILTSKPSLHHRPSHKPANHDDSVKYNHRQKRRFKVDTRSCDSMDSSIASGSVDWDAVDQILNS